METYDEIYGRMKNAYEHETGDSFNEVSDIAIRCLQARFLSYRRILNGGKDRCLQ